MLDFSDQPYRFVAAKPRLAWIKLARWFNRLQQFPRPLHRLTGVEVDDPGSVMPRLRENRGARLLFVANHSRHSDPHVMMEAQDQMGVVSCFMAAYDIFHRGRLAAWMLPRLGVFSVDREGSDARALRAATEILVQGRHALTLFPEGNVYLNNDRVTPFLDGASFLALKAQKELGAEKPVYVVPVSVKYTLVQDCRQEVRTRLEVLGEQGGATMRHAPALRDELVRIGLLLMRKLLSRHGYDGTSNTGDAELAEVLRATAGQILQRLEASLQIKPADAADPVARIRKIRQVIHQARTAEDGSESASMETIAREAMLVLRIMSYDGGYVEEDQSLDRFAETVEKIEEDWHGRMMPSIGLRKAIVKIGEPVSLAEELEAFRAKPRATLEALTERLESRVQEGLHAVRGRLDTAGAEPF